MITKLGSLLIYDRFIQKGAKLGYQANKVIRLLKKEEFLTELESNTLAKSKPERLAQRIKFVNLSAAGLEELRTLMHNFANNIRVEEDDNHLDLQDIPKNVRARAWHLADDPQAVGYLT